jgi:hypothetical protein
MFEFNKRGEKRVYHMVMVHSLDNANALFFMLTLLSFEYLC